MRALNRTYIALAGITALASLAACQSKAPDVPTTSYRVLAATETAKPVASAIYVNPPRRTAPRVNEFGGEIPKAAPATPVGEGGLGEIR